ncbi:hypothetical protein CEUSTIGMA_g8935.t1 [Chlamydomonas eustigma]|uniref:Methyltransferase domain-containing protein n=1 Tax=Chlamydomonas eustigma TaxID=1157962 RepID=A0A250XEL1_9CHLO|nr:hypothetical protein CEUSTIGMA_g8935.t1 [Chlamydomonas eustigma]|eukprot:GAX81507.1 hypothetical protein CEUSTIGMA_g8935.t1 [Chlamydomonas eustigma]
MMKMRLGNTMEEYSGSSEDKRIFAPAAQRNKQHVCDVLEKYLVNKTACTSVLEVACGTGEHTALFAASLPHLTFRPTDLTSQLFDSVIAHSAGLSNVLLPPATLDASNEEQWEALLGTHSSTLRALVCINMTHISPLAATTGLIQAAGRYLEAGEGLLFIYGPFTVDGGKHTSESNEAFDADLRSRNSEWGYRDIEDITRMAVAKGLVKVEIISMPANNFTLVFKRAAETLC